jgi:23S rRNA (cytosine1962-C5)-methyltransferase
MLIENEVQALVEQVLEQRKALFDDSHLSAFRLFNGFSEGLSGLAIDLYARTLVIFNYAEPPEQLQGLVGSFSKYLLDALPWIQAVLVKTRSARDEAARRGQLVYGDKEDRRVREHGVWYAIDLIRSQDASLYLDTRLLRRWIIDHAANMRVLNCFAYTGSLGVAALAGGARQVIHLDRNRSSLNLAKDSYSLNGFPISRSDFIPEDFFIWTSRMRRLDQRFDLALLDPPFFSVSPTGKVDLNTQPDRLINKVRPLLEDGGLLVAINNALYVSGVAYLQQLEALCQDGYLSIEEFISVPSDFSGFNPTGQVSYPTDPAPFNHPTKIALLKAKRKP